MEKKIKILYILSILSILAFLGMQIYWLYSRYEYSLWEYEDKAIVSIVGALDHYYTLRKVSTKKDKDETTHQASYSMHYYVDSIGRQRRSVTVTTQSFNGRHLLGINEDRELTEEEKEHLAKIVSDSIEAVEVKKASMDASTAPSEGAAWGGMSNFELEMTSPFTSEGIDSLLRKEKIDADVSLSLSDSVMWKPVVSRHTSILDPRFKYINCYSELERKIAVIDCKIPTSVVIREMAWTLVLAFIISVILIICLVWQIKTIVKLNRLDKMRNMFITTMIHELKRPISTLKMCVSGIENDRMIADKEIKAELMVGARTALDNLSAYFSKLRDITFNNVEQIPLNMSSFNLAALVDGVIKSITLPSAKDVVFENTVPEDFEISADRSHLMNILTNLIENAIKYSGSKVAIKIKAVKSHDRCEISVEDDGNGIPAADLNKIFNRFYRGKASTSDIPGMGLGLAYVKLLTDAHGGEITVESAEGVGSSFSIKLPQ